MLTNVSIGAASFTSTVREWLLGQASNMTELELLIRKNTLKDVELWLNQQYLEIEKELMTFVDDRGDDSDKDEVEID